MSDQININPQWVLAGDAIFTLSNGRGKHETFRVYKRELMQQGNKTLDTYFIKVLTGPDNLHDYTYLGMVILPNRKHADPTVRLTANSRFKEDSPPLKAARFILRAIWQIDRGTYKLPAGYTIKHIGRCGRCHQPLTTPASLDTGYGPDCAEALGIVWRERERVQGTVFDLVEAK